MKRRLLVLCPAPQGTAAGQRFKYEPHFDDWRAAGWDITVAPFMDDALWRVVYEPGHVFAKIFGVLRGYWRRRRDLARLADYDLVYVYLNVTPLGTARAERRVLRRARRVIYDLEDNLVAASAAGGEQGPNRWFGWLKGRNKARVLASGADAVIVASPFLVDEVAAIARGSVHCIPPSLDTERIRPAPPAPREGPLVIGWTGTFSSRAYLDTLAPALRRLRQRLPFVLRVIGNFDYAMDGVDVDVVRWSAEREAEDLQSLDIGIYPLPDDPWTRGKAGLKIIQYHAAGLPVVASDVPLSRRQVADGESGFLVADDLGWVDRLERLARDPALRARMGAAGRAVAVATYDTRVVAGLYRSALAAALAAR